MKIITLLALFIAVGCILATGCIAQTKKDVNNTTVSVTNTFTPFNNTTMNSTNSFNMTNVTNVTNISVLKGPLRVSISTFNANLSVIIDNQTAGFVSTAKPLDILVPEGNHSVKVCVGAICEMDYVNIIFAKKTFIDFGDRLKKNVGFPEPTARITDYYKDGDGVAIIVEFINPSEKDLQMTAEISLGYSYISYRSNQRVGESVRGKAYSNVDAGRRTSEMMHLYFADGNAYMFDPPTIGKITLLN